MNRLRREQETLEYSRLLASQDKNPITATQRLAHTPHAYYEAPRVDDNDLSDDAIYADLSRQTALIINVLVSIIACSVALWMAARHWSVAGRLGLSMCGSGVVAVAEVVVYMSYLRKVDDAKAKGRKQVERKEIVKTWVFGGDKGKDVDLMRIDEPKGSNATKARRRKGRE